MNLFQRPFLSSPFCQPRGGFALVIVLIILAVNTVLIMGLLMMVTDERKTAQTEASGSGAHGMADAVTQIVIGQIRQATSSAGASGALTWASQPGMIRSYDSNGILQTSYKLYSSGVMTTTGALTLGGTAATGANQVNDFDPAWSGNTALWTDLNAPVTDASGTQNYPIIDGNNLQTSGGVSTYTAASNGLPSIQGFSVNNPPLATSGSVINQIPMPVQWLYQLRDGTLAAATAAGANTVTVAGASAANPIVGRIAFWTDDETSKININTACGDVWNPTAVPVVPAGSPAGGANYSAPGAFWDVPRTYSAFEYNNLAYLQPAQHEYQRYPGHPANVYLSAVFPGLTETQLFNWIPRIIPSNPSISEGGTVMPNQTTVSPNANRLYASVDELLFAPTITQNPPDRDLNDPSAVNLDKATLERAKFFLTVDSRAPEVNLFGQPRVGVWPIDSDVIAKETSGTLSPRGTAFDALIAFCCHLGTLGNGNDYCFQRQANGYLSQTADANIARNVILYTYLQTLMGTNIPGFGGNFKNKFSTDTNQILTEIYDYIRCINPSDDNIAFGIPAPPQNGNNPTSPQYGANCYTPSGTYTTTFLTGGYSSGFPVLAPNPYHAFIAPAQIGSTQGFGRTVTLSEVGLSFICNADGTLPDTTMLTSAAAVTAYVAGASSPEPQPTTANLWMLVSNIPTPGGTGIPVTAPSTVSTYLQTTPSAWTQVRNYWLSLINSSSSFATQQVPALPTSTIHNINLQATTPMLPTQRRAQAIFLVNPYTVSPGYSTMHMDIGIEVAGLDGIMVNGIGIGFPHDRTVVMSNYTYRTPTFGVNFPFFLNAYIAPIRGLPEGSQSDGDANFSPTGQGYNDSRHPPYRIYEFISAPFTVAANNSMTVSGGSNVQIKIWHLSPGDETSFTASSATPNSPSSSSCLIQTIPLGNLGKPAPAGLEGNWTPPGLVVTQDNDGEINAHGGQTGATFTPETEWDFSWAGVFGDGSIPGRLYDGFDRSGHYFEPAFVSYDVLKTMVPGYPTDTTGVGGDYRLLAAQNNVGANVFVAHRLVNDVPATTLIHSFSMQQQSGQRFDETDPRADLEVTSPSPSGPFGALVTSTPPQGVFGGNIKNLLAVQTGDFDNGVGADMDGPYINKPDTGYSINTGSNYSYPYFGWFAENSLPSFFSPNRQIPSPGMFGSLPVGVIRQLPWQTLLFRPQPTHPDGVAVPDTGASTSATSPYPTNGPADHLLMDLFWMPTVEPYAISEPFSTAGKINLNYQIAPFTYITRATALAALMKSQQMLAIPTSAQTQNWKIPFNSSPGPVNLAAPAPNYRYPLNVTNSDGTVNTSGTLRQFAEKFAGGDIFRSPTQICDIYLTPQGQNWSSNSQAVSFWAANQLTGDNSRERPYANLYGCLTTKSNTYTVHFRVQTLQKIPTTPANQWVDGKDVVTSDYRGSTLLERYVDPSNASLPDFASHPADPNYTLDSYYKFRILSTRRFSP